MTIAAGVLCMDGVALAADTKESYGDTHTYVGKIATIHSDHGSYAIASSGEAYLLDYITPALDGMLRVFIGTYGQLHAALGAVMVKAYRSDELQAYPHDKAEDLYTQFLVAAQLSGTDGPRLFIINSTLVTEATQLGTVIGCGPLREIGEEMGLAAMRGIERAKAAALCIVYEAKRRYSDVGGKTDVVAIGADCKIVHNDKELEVEREPLVDDLRRLSHAMTVTALDPSVDTRNFNRYIAFWCTRIREIHRKAAEIERRHSAQQKNKITKLVNRGRREHLKRLASQT
jgi:hypothetical protein